MFAQAALWGVLAGSGLLIGAAVAVVFDHRLSHRVIATVMGFGGGVASFSRTSRRVSRARPA